MQKPNDPERRITAAAREVFIKKGFAQASMSDIAHRAGINRPTLHYYFRTKDRMFEAVAGEIVSTFLPSIHDIIVSERPPRERIEEVVDIYCAAVSENPGIPVFLVNELRRDAGHIVRVISDLGFVRQVESILSTLNDHMERGILRRQPPEFILYTFYGLIIIPFLARPLVDLISPAESSERSGGDAWKSQAVDLLCHALLPG